MNTLVPLSGSAVHVWCLRGDGLFKQPTENRQHCFSAGRGKVNWSDRCACSCWGLQFLQNTNKKCFTLLQGNKTMTGSWMTTGHVCRQIQQLTPQSEACDKRQIIDKLQRGGWTPPQNSCDQAGAKLISYTHNILAETWTRATNRRELGGCYLLSTRIW